MMVLLGDEGQALLLCQATVPPGVGRRLRGGPLKVRVGCLGGTTL